MSHLRVLARLRQPRPGPPRAAAAEGELFRAVFENALVPISIVDDDRRYVDANAAKCELLARPRRELVGLRIDDTSPPEELADLAVSWRELLADGRREGRYVVQRPHGERRTVDYTARAHVLPGRHVIVLSDVTERLRLEERLRVAARADALGRLAGGVAHDFNNLLTVIGGYTDALLRRAEDERTRHDLEEIAQAAARAAALTQQLLAYGGRQSRRQRDVSPAEVVRGLERMLRPLVGDGVDLVAELDPRTPHVRGDVGQLEQVVVNLVVNARDALADGGRITLSTGETTLGAAAAVATGELAPGRYATLAVADTGHGIPSDTLPHIFEPFYTTKAPGRGTGLGLASVCGIVRQSGGAVDVESEPGHGATFTVFLPASSGPGEREAGPPHATGADAGGETVLVVDDENLVRELVEEVLRERGYRVLAARDGDEALELVRTHEGGIDLILTDVVMPKMSGRELVRRVAPEQPRMRVLYTSGYSDEPPEPSAPFLQKPFTIDALTRAVREALGS